MGFGSYDESEQQAQEVNTEDDGSEGVDVRENDHDGEMTFESGATTDDLLDRLGEMKASSDDG